MPHSLKHKRALRAAQLASEGSYFEANESELECPDGLSIGTLDLMPAPAKQTRQRFTEDDKSVLLQAVKDHHWTTAREAYGWAWTQIGLRVSYLTVWRFLTSQGLLTGDTPRSRRLKSDP
jgi:hypothetical protein